MDTPCMEDGRLMAFITPCSEARACKDLQELADASPEHKPLRRRVAILIGQWVPQLKGEDRPTVYRALLDLLADEDFGVSMAGVAAFQDLVDDWAFTEDQFIDFVSPCFQLLALRLQASREYETQIQVKRLYKDSFTLEQYSPMKSRNAFVTVCTSRRIHGEF